MNMPMELTALSLVGHILLIVLLVIIVLVVLLLFAPFKYELDAKISEELNVRFKVRFLAGIFEFAIVYKEKQTLMRIRLFGFKKRLRKKEETPKEPDEEDKTAQKKDIPAMVKEFFSFVSDKANRDLVKYTIKRVVKLLKRIAPDVIRTNIDYSLGEPDRTGLVTGAISLIPIVYMYEIHAYPDFESDNMYVRGKAQVKGKIHMIFVLACAISLFKNKKFRELIKKFRRSKNGG
ncbi:MAG: hypothetical protein K6G01_03215 [Eubacterium sp.]|nr:hypothetical protein [Eubacterium sp.]